MDKFLEIVYSNQLADSDKGDKFEDFFTNARKKLHNADFCVFVIVK